MGMGEWVRASAIYAAWPKNVQIFHKVVRVIQFIWGWAVRIFFLIFSWVRMQTKGMLLLGQLTQEGAFCCSGALYGTFTRYISWKVEGSVKVAWI